jgi:hypothetical protein
MDRHKEIEQAAYQLYRWRLRNEREHEGDHLSDWFKCEEAWNDQHRADC